MNFGFVTNMKVNKVFFSRDYEFELPYEVEVPEDVLKMYEPNRLLLFILCKLICEKPDEVVNGLSKNDSNREE